MRNIVILNSLHFSYPLPILMRVSYNTLIVKQNTSDYYKYTNLFLYGEIFSFVRTEQRVVSRGMKGKGERKRQAEEPEFFRLSLCDSSQCYSLTFARFTLPAVWTSTT